MVLVAWREHNLFVGYAIAGDQSNLVGYEGGWNRKKEIGDLFLDVPFRLLLLQKARTFRDVQDQVDSYRLLLKTYLSLFSLLKVITHKKLSRSLVYFVLPAWPSMECFIFVQIQPDKGMDNKNKVPFKLHQILVNLTL